VTDSFDDLRDLYQEVILITAAAHATHAGWIASTPLPKATTRCAATASRFG
jgi:hypothetical protein